MACQCPSSFYFSQSVVQLLFHYKEVSDVLEALSSLFLSSLPSNLAKHDIITPTAISTFLILHLI